MRNKNSIKFAVATVIIISIIIAAVVYIYDSKQIYGGNGIYYTQQETGEYIQFNKDKTFTLAYNPQNDKDEKTSNQADILGEGTWEKSGNKIALTFLESDTPIIFIEKDEYIYRENKIFRGITSDAKLLNNGYLLEQTEDQSLMAWFFDDGKMSFETRWGKDVTIKSGTYTRTDDILTVRYNDKSTTAERYLVLENGITKDIYAKKLP